MTRLLKFTSGLPPSVGKIGSEHLSSIGLRVGEHGSRLTSIMGDMSDRMNSMQIVRDNTDNAESSGVPSLTFRAIGDKMVSAMTGRPEAPASETRLARQRCVGRVCLSTQPHPQQMKVHRVVGARASSQLIARRPSWPSTIAGGLLCAPTAKSGRRCRYCRACRISKGK